MKKQILTKTEELKILQLMAVDEMLLMFTLIIPPGVAVHPRGSAATKDSYLLLANKSTLSRPSTPAGTSINVNGKHPRSNTHSASIRQGDWLKHTHTALQEWQYSTKRSKHAPAPFTSEAILPNKTLTMLALNPALQNIEDLNPPWMLVLDHGDDVLAVLACVDEAEQLEKEQRKESRRDLRRLEKENRGTEQHEMHTGSANVPNSALSDSSINNRVQPPDWVQFVWNSSDQVSAFKLYIDVDETTYAPAI
ncbi:hypothetical protein JAAARDRAFT_201073 [Jaapia argillacea MUCL 33604]|uniref:Uncharacterized protein n=1 Tax=Jaapia argillacea MUCL 33604 TaxID=933084 RepID=A0A067PFE9_9AGAM|nr:hypothetical protein JAAARDRAFT_201073 [Jaapia argillacea MUCL 33604]